MANWLENLTKSIDDTWNGRLTQQGGQQANSSAAKWDGMTKNIGNFFADANNNARDSTRKRLEQHGYATPHKPDIARAAPIRSMSVGNADGSSTAGIGLDPSPGPQAQPQGDHIIDMLRQAIDASNVGDNPYMSGLNEARSASLKAIADTRNTTNANFQQSNDAIGGIYAKGKQDTLADNQILKDNNANLVGGLGAMYGGEVKSLQDDRSKAMNEKTDMLQRLGIQGAGLGTTGDVQTKAIADASASQQSAQDKALQYGGADLTANTARADGLISEGAGRQSQLRSQLSGILGQLSNKELDINNQFANQSMQANNQNYQDKLSRTSALYGMIDKERAAGIARDKLTSNSSVLAALARNQGRMNSNGMDNIANADGYISAQGQNPGDYQSAYTDAQMNAKSSMPGSMPNDQDVMVAMSKHAGLDPNLIQNYIQIKKNPSKYGTGNSGGGGGIDTNALMNMLGQ